MSKILIVDDEVDTLEACVMYLEMEGYEVYGAKNSKEALEIIEKERPETLILDLNLKESVSGLDILEEANKIYPNVHAAVLTGHTESKVSEKCRSAGVKMIVIKPIAIEKFKEIVETLEKGG